MSTCPLNPISNLFQGHPFQLKNLLVLPGDNRLGGTTLGIRVPEDHVLRLSTQSVFHLCILLETILTRPSVR